MAYEAAREGWLDQLPQTGLENSWRYQNGRRVDADENGVATLSLPDGVSTFSANGHWGIDVSRHQGTIDWKAVKNAGVEFAVIRCGYGDGIEKGQKGVEIGAYYNLTNNFQYTLKYGFGKSLTYTYSGQRQRDKLYSGFFWYF